MLKSGDANAPDDIALIVADMASDDAALKKRQVALRPALVEYKRQSVWQDGQQALKAMPVDELRKHLTLRAADPACLADLVLSHGASVDRSALLSARARKRQVP